MSGADLDTRVRTQAFQFLTEQTRFHGGWSRATFWSGDSISKAGGCP